MRSLSAKLARDEYMLDHPVSFVCGGGAMSIWIRVLALSMMVLLLSSAHSAEPEKKGPAWVYHFESEFEFAKQDLTNAIEGRGMVISYISHAQDMLERTAGAVGVTQSVYGEAEIFLFCKSDLSHKLMAANPHNIALCPYAISIYTLAEDQSQVYLSFRNPYTIDDAYKPVVTLLQEIITEVIGG